MIKTFLISFFGFLILDLVWLGFVVRDFNARHLSEIGRIENGKFEILYAPALAVYLLMALALTVFVIPRLGPETPWWQSFLLSAVMGLIVYGVYDFTNLAILKGYPLPFVAADVAWGFMVFGIVGTLTNIWVHA